MNIAVLAEDGGIERFYCNPSFDLYKDKDAVPIMKVGDAFHYPLLVDEDVEFALSTNYNGCLVLFKTEVDEETYHYNYLYKLEFNKSDLSSFKIKDLVSM